VFGLRPGDAIATAAARTSVGVARGPALAIGVVTATESEVIVAAPEFAPRGCDFDWMPPRETRPAPSVASSPLEVTPRISGIDGASGGGTSAAAAVPDW
jgi:hypothetical protein